MTTPTTVRSFGDLTGCNAVVTGSSSGIGLAIGRELARGGANVVLHSRKGEAEGALLVAEIERFGVAATYLRCDIANEAGLSRFVDDAWNAFGSVEIWVNNAGVDLLTGDGSRAGYSEKLARLFEVDVRGTMLLSKLAAQRMREAGRGVILNIGWDQADRGMEGESGELFAASKNAVMGFTRSLATSFAPEVRVNCIAPGWIKTAWGETASEVWQERVRRETPLRRWGTPEDIARAARFLASPDAAYITGQVINVNGGAVR
ncbi:MAG: SDR family NAD(P)-dependent oxidoreductase [Planctomycetaceae bacterium]